MAVSNGTIKDIVSSLKTDTKVRNSTYQAEVTRIDKQTGVAYVRLAGSDRETPTELTAAEVKKGDSVTVEWRNNKLYIGGNYSSPSVGTQRILIVEKDIGTAQQTADTANETAKTAKKTADTARQIAGNTDQYFWHTETGTDTGAHITEVPKEDFEEDPTNGGGNLLARSNGVAIRDGLTELATFSQDGQSWSGIDSGGNASVGAKLDIEITTDGDNKATLSALDSLDSDETVSLELYTHHSTGGYKYARLGADGKIRQAGTGTVIGSYNSRVSVGESGTTISNFRRKTSDRSASINFVDLEYDGGAGSLINSSYFNVDLAGNIDTAGDITVGGHDSPIGSRLSAVWTASSSSASGTAMTGDITLTPGVWMLGMITPTCTATKAYYFSNISSSLSYPYFTMGTGGSGWVPVEITTNTTTHVASGASTACNYSNLTRGRILAVRIA